jgi:hypothetical protein
MKKCKKVSHIFLITSLIIGIFFSYSWAQDETRRDELNVLDVILARPLGVVAGIIGTGVFIVSLPFTIPTKSVEKAANIFIVEPFKFSFVREFPDEEL